MKMPATQLAILLLFAAAATLFGAGDASLRRDAVALISLKHALRCTGSAALDSWHVAGAAGVCGWAGIRCDGGRVAAVDLSNLNMTCGGNVAVSGLHSVVNFSIAANAIAGSITVSDMPALRVLNISSNQLAGDLAWNYSSLPNLEVFDAYDNNFTAALPAGVAALKKLRYLDLGGSFFFGNIPRAFGEMPALEYLSLNGNDLHGRIPPELGNLTALKQLYLGYYNAFDGGLPPELGRLRSLVHLDASSCGLAGRIPPELGALSSLDALFLHTNNLTGPIPPELGRLTSLTSLDLSNNALTGAIPGELSSLAGLKLLNLFMNRLTGQIPDFIASMPALETLQLFMNKLEGPIPPSLGKTGQQLQLLDLSSNALTGGIPGEVCAGGRLRVLILMNNLLSGPIPAGLGRCPNLTRVRLGNNRLAGPIPSGLLYSPRLNLLELQNNRLSGPLPENPAAGSTQLVQLNLSNNSVSGPIPAALSDLSALEALLMSTNRLSGPIPTGVARLGRLAKLDLSSNRLSGPIPPEIGRCDQLTYLDLSRNCLSGSIPGDIAAIPMLNYLNLSRNSLQETIPAAIATMRSLTAADFSYNELSGPVPATGQLAYLNASAFAGNPGLCGVASPCGGGAPAVRRPTDDFKLLVALGMLACSIAFASVAVCQARSYRRSPEGPGAWRFTAFHKVDFGAAEVVECMKEGNVVGRGGAGVVYAGRTRSGGAIAVKKLLGGVSGEHDHGFRAEVRTLGRIRHRNIVRLLAVCTNRAASVLVYEYMGNGSLGEVLHGKAGGFLGWDRRYRIAVEAARGLCYLHHDCSPTIIHRDVKSNNILLGDGFEAHVADFGLARFLRAGDSECMSAVAGSYGYIAPEYAYTLKVDEKSDVYSYGVVLLELITGRRPVGSFGEGVDIVQWAKAVTGGRRDAVPKITDPRLGGGAPGHEVAHLFFVSMLCVQDDSVQRPTMREVVQMLSELARHASAEPSPPSSLSPSSSAASAAAPKEICCSSISSCSPDKNGRRSCYKNLFPDFLK